ncbi:hypothetical protein D3C71_1526070 [compost metagenome]
MNVSTPSAVLAARTVPSTLLNTEPVWNLASPASTSAMVSEPMVVSTTPAALGFSVIVRSAWLSWGVSLVPVMVTAICASVPSAVRTVTVSVSVWPSRNCWMTRSLLFRR